MAHFAEIDESNMVVRVIVVADADTADADGVEVESIGVQFCHDLLGGTWIQASYNTHNGVYSTATTDAAGIPVVTLGAQEPLRSNFPGISDVYLPDVDAFQEGEEQKPYPSWVHNENHVWVAPVPRPDGGPIWNEETGEWDAHVPGDEQNTLIGED